MLSIEDALDHVLDGVLPLPSARIPLVEAAGRVLAEPIRCDRDQPPFNRSAMDGFAVRAADVAEAPVGLDVIGAAPAGVAFEGTVGPGQAVRIMTGAPVPAGADAVQMIENTEPAPPGGVVTILKAVALGQHIAERGQDIRGGEVALAAGVTLRRARLAVAWSMGAVDVSVFARPKVAVLTTGDELVALHETPGPTQIRDSNRCSMIGIVESVGAVVVSAEVVRDDRAATQAAIARALNVCDVLALSGGVSAGDYDYVAECLAAEGVEQVFHKVNMKPGKPLWFGRRGQQRVFGLPGNPVSTYVAARIFMAPTLRRMRGLSPERCHDPRVMMPLLESARGTKGRPTFAPCEVVWGQGVRLITTRGSGDLRHFSQANAIALIPPHEPRLEAGREIEVLLDPETLVA